MKTWKKLLLWIVILPLLFFTAASLYLISQKDELTQKAIADYSKTIQGRIEVAHTKISPFENFPYISIDLQDVLVFENKTTNQAFVQIEDAYIGLDLLKIIRGKFDIKAVKLAKGDLQIIQNTENEYNAVTAFESLNNQEETSSENESLDYHLKKIKLEKIHLSKLSLKDSLQLDAQIETATSQLKSLDNQIKIHLDSDLTFNLINQQDTSFIKNKQMELHTDFLYDLKGSKIDFDKTQVEVESGVFGMSGHIDLADEVNMNLKFEGQKSNFDLFIALAPEEVSEALMVYENQGDVFFEASIKGKSINGNSPLVEARFGCKNGFFDNIEENKKLSDLNFLGSFTNGSERNIRTSEVKIQNFSASPEAGIFKGNLRITNFESPEIDLELDSDFDLNFLTGFFNLNDLRNLTGQVDLKMKFNDIIDLENPEKALEEFNQAYFASLSIKNLNFTTDSYHLPIQNLNIQAEMDGELTTIDFFKFQLGSSDLSLKGSLTRLPDIIHQTNKAVEMDLQIVSDFVNFTELTSTSEEDENIFDEEIDDFKTKFKFQGKANTFLTSEILPIGTFYIEELNGKFKNYPHQLHDFFARIYIDKNDIKIEDLKGMLDDSDIHFSGNLTNYPILMNKEKEEGDVVFDFDLDANLIRLKDVFSYGEENYVPEDYREEVLREIRGKGSIDLHYKDSLVSSDFNLDVLKGRMRIHPLKFNDFKGNLHLENEQLSFRNFSGKIGKSKFSVSGNYYLGKDKELLKKGDIINFKASVLDIDELTNYKEPEPDEEGKVDHDDVFNIFEVPFRNMKINAAIGKLNYHKYLIDNFSSELRMQDDHYIYVDDMRFEAAGGKVALAGYFNGSNPDSIYMHPDLKMQEVDLDQLFFKFDNFGQDQMVSNNLHGVMTGRIKGKVLMHKDLTPYTEKSNLTIDVSVKNGMLENFEPMQALSDFFNDKNLNKVFFGSLENRLELKDGSIVIPTMVINSSLGFMQLSGKQGLDLEMDYYLKIPLKLVTQVASRKLFGSKKEEIDPEQEDEIIEKDLSKKTSYVNVRMKGNPEDYSISLKKNRKEEKGAKAFEKEADFLFDDIKIEKFSW
ncbi:MAG: AsmA-like C-terminal region-containing protein [Psychroflexus maritimus]